MAYTARELIINAFYVTGIVAKEFQTVSGPQVSDGLEYLNELLGDARVDDGLAPYYTRYTFTTIAGQEKYDIPGLIEADTLTFNLDGVRYSMESKQRIEYFETARANNVQSLPVIYHVERKLNGADIYMYFLPQQAYAMELWGQFGLDTVALGDDLETVYDPFYISYLKYALAGRICENYDYDVTANLAKRIKYYEGVISKQSQQLDMKIRKISTLQSRNLLNYAQVNLGKGWVVP